MPTDVLDLPALDTGYALTADAIDGFRRDGHICLPGVCTADEASAYHQVIAGAADRLATERRPLAERDTYAKAFLQIMNLWVRDEAVRRYTLARRFGKIAAELMGVDGVRIYHDQALFKEPGGGLTPWHQDQYYWPLDTDKTVTMWMPLVDLTDDMGILTFASGSHADGYLGVLPISDHSEQVFRDYVRDRGFGLWSTPRMAAGDATFHTGWTLHAAPGNTSSRMRAVMTVIFHAADATISEPDNPNRERDLANWLPGLRPGDVAASPLNPLVYHRG